MRIITYDFEVFAYDWLVVLKDKETGHYTVIHNDNEALAQAMNQEDLYFGYNSKHYDQYIAKGVVAGFTPQELKALNDFIIAKHKQGWEYPGLRDIYWRFNNVDLMDDTQLGTSLKSIEAHRFKSIKESNVPFDIDRPLTPEEIEETIKYCKHDVDNTEDLIEIRKDYLQTKIDLGQMASLTPAKALSMTNAKLTAAVLGAVRKDFNDERQYVYPDNLLKEWIEQEVFDFFNRMYDPNISDKALFESKHVFYIGKCEVTIAWGGVHGARRCYEFYATDDRAMLNDDVGSYYPHLCTINGYTSRSLPSPVTYVNFLESRMRAKAEGRTKEANAKKLVCNTKYGCMKNQYNDLYDPLMARSVCISGQLYLLELAYHAYKTIPNLEICQLNTDGIMVECDREYIPMWHELCDEWQARTHFELEEDDIAEIHQKDVNNYCERQTNGKEKAKGAYLVKGISTVGAFKINNSACVVAKAVYECLMNGTPVEQTINECNEIQDFQIVAKASSKYKTVYHEVDGQMIETQKVNRVYATANPRYGKLYKLKTNGDYETTGEIADTDDEGQIAKIGSLPEHCIVDNDNELTIEEVDKTFYIEMAQKQVNDFKGIKPEKKSKRRTKEMATTTKTATPTNVYQKLIKARNDFLVSDAKKTGKNMNIGFKYFELEDIVPTATKIFLEVGLVAIVNFTNEVATLTIVNTDNTEEAIDFTAPFNQIQPIVSNAGKQVTNDMQALGSSITYMRRYLYMIALDICESDDIEPTIDKSTNNASTTSTAPTPTKAAPATAEQRQEVKQELTAPADNATALQIKGLKGVLKKLKDADPSKEEMIAKIAVETEGFTKISKADCEKLIERINAMVEEVSNG